MPIFRQRPPQIEARHFAKNRDNKFMQGLVDWINENGGQAAHDLVMITIGGFEVCSLGDWIVRSGNKFTVVSQTAFSELYEPA